MAEIIAKYERWLWVREEGPDGVYEHRVYLDPRLERQIEGYFSLMEARPELFTHSELYPADPADLRGGDRPAGGTGV